jgi:hypothetical protein
MVGFVVELIKLKGVSLKAQCPVALVIAVTRT